MSKQQSDEKFVCKPKKVLKNNKGFSLLEIVIATSISTVVSLAVASIFIYTVRQFVVMVEMNAAQENLLWSAYHTKNLLSQAVNIDTGLGLIGDGHINDANQDGVADFNRTTTAAAVAAAAGPQVMPINQDILAQFFYENGDAAGGSSYQQVRFTRQNPSQNRGELGQGYIFIDVSTPMGQTMTVPSFADVFYNKVVQYDLIPTCRLSGGVCQQTTSIDVNITTRHHNDSDDATWVWCDPLTIAANACPTPLGTVDSSYVDHNMNFSVGLRNNGALTPDPADPTKALSIHGGIYYFRYSPPVINF